MLQKLFKLKENGTDIKTEILAGITTFMTMAYILAVNPDILSVAGFNRRYGYDAFGVAQIVNDPITVDEGFLSTMKHAIIAAFQDDSTTE